MGFIHQLSHWANEATGSAGPRIAVNQALTSYGKLTKFSIDHAAKHISGEIMLKGEKEPIAFAVDGYELQPVGDSRLLTIQHITLSREWMQTAAAEFLKNPIPIPEKYAKWLDLIL